jgi:hypothetical protein
MTMIITPDEAQPEEAPLPPWTIEWRGQVFHESDLTGRHLSVLAMIVGNDNFSMLDMDPSLGHQRLMFVITAFLAVSRVSGISDPDEAAGVMAQAVAEVADAPVEEILSSIRYE